MQPGGAESLGRILGWKSGPGREGRLRRGPVPMSSSARRTSSVGEAGRVERYASAFWESDCSEGLGRPVVQPNRAARRRCFGEQLQSGFCAIQRPGTRHQRPNLPGGT